MLISLFDGHQNLVMFIGLLLAFIATCVLTHTLKNFLPRDGGRAYAVNGALSQGKPRGAGIVFILVFSLFAILFTEVTRENIIYILMIIAAMLSGYLDDSSKKPWGELKKGLIDLALAVVCAVTYVNFNSPTLNIAILDMSVELPAVVYIILAVILIWASINVTNCSDGVDGLCGSLSIVTLITMYIFMINLGNDSTMPQLILIMVVCLLGYLWFNASPSKLIMGDAGSRAIGIFIALAALKSGHPLMFIPAALVIILDGGLGLLKVSLLRFLKIHILKNTRTPLHDHVRKNKGWSDTQTVFRFIIIQVAISFLMIYAVKL